jgi:hypothetical protein
MPQKFKLKSILKAVHSQDEFLLDDLQTQIGEQPNIAWYPSAGLDFRDLMEVNRTQIDPDVFFHTDYNSNWLQLNCGVVFKDESTSVSIERITELKFRSKVNYIINPEYVDFPNDAPQVPKIFLLDVKLESKFGEINKPVIYFFMENINFLDEVLLHFKISLSHLIKVREGCGMGGNRKSISLAYAFLGNLNVQFLLVDNEEHTDKELIKTIALKHKIAFRKYELRNAAQRRNIANWSDYAVKVLDVLIFNDQQLSDLDFDQILVMIRRP